MIQSIEKFYNQSSATEISQYNTIYPILSTSVHYNIGWKKEELGLEFELFLWPDNGRDEDEDS